MHGVLVEYPRGVPLRVEGSVQLIVIQGSVLSLVEVIRLNDRFLLPYPV